MDKAVLISIRPNWCELITSGKKTVEVRKTRPKLETPFKCYIYETRGFERVGNESLNCVVGGNGRGAVISEFVCDEMARYAKYGYRGEPARYKRSSPGGYPATEIHYSSLQLSPDDFEQYGKGDPLYGWYISDLVIYDEPKKLSDFYVVCQKPYCGTSCKRYPTCGALANWRYPVTRPPQSWMYVEELEE